MKAMYELEQKIMSCWQVVDDMKATSGDGVRELDVESMRSILKGMQILYDLRFDELFATYEAALDEIRGVTVDPWDDLDTSIDDKINWDDENDLDEVDDWHYGEEYDDRQLERRWGFDRRDSLATGRKLRPDEDPSW